MCVVIGLSVDPKKAIEKIRLIENATLIKIEVMADNLVHYLKLSKEERLDIAAQSLGYNSYEVAVKKISEKEAK